jgi:hypothetical protein
MDMSVTIQVPIPDDLLVLLEQKARGAGLDREQYVSAIVSRDLAGLRRLDEVLSSFRGQVASSGLSDSELADLFSAARSESTQDPS